jgi:Yip1 domain
MNAHAEPADLERDWWLRLLVVLQAPSVVFAALRDDSREAAEARQEPITALVVVAGIAGFLLQPAARTVMDSNEVDGLTAAVIIFLGGAFTGVATYWLGGVAVVAGARGAGLESSYRRGRHVLAFAATPLVLSLLLIWPVRLALYGSDAFRSGGTDTGAGADVLLALDLALAAWAVGLLALGFRVTYRLSWRRVPLALVVTAVALAALLIVTQAVFGGLGGGG